MQRVPKTGDRHERQFVVGEADFAGNGMPAVLRTPQLVLWLEYTARDLVAPMLADGQTTVGTVVDVEHLAPTLPGATVTCRARVLTVDGPIVTFQVEADDGHEPISRGVHKRCILDVDRFNRRVERKRQAMSDS